jgi:hypothetical protein
MPKRFTPQDLQALPEAPASWVVQDLLRTNRKRVSLIAGSPEAGKSTIARQLSIAVSQGIAFLGRATKQGKVIYWQSEEDPQDTKEDFFRTGMAANDPVIIVHPEAGDDNCAELCKILDANPDTRLVIIETLDDFLKVEDIKENTAGREAFERFDAEVVSKHCWHCAFIVLHWFKKSDRQKTANIHKILGGTIIAGKTDAKVYLTQVSDSDPRRIIQVAVRKGVPIEPTYLLFEPENQTSQLGTKVADERLQHKDVKDALAEIELDSRISALLHQNPGKPKAEIKKLVGGNGERVGKRLNERITAGDISVIAGGKYGNAKLLYLTGDEPVKREPERKEEALCQ